MALDDDQPLSGAQFARQVGIDPEKWAARFLAAFTAVEAEGLRTDADRLAFVASWFADAMEAAVKANWRDGLGQAMRTSKPTRTWTEMVEIADRRFFGDKKPSD